MNCGPVQRASERARELRVGHRIGRRRVDRACHGGVSNRPAHQLDPVLAMDPGPVLPARSDRPAGAELERQQHLRQRAAVALEHESGADAHDARARAGRADGFGFPLRRRRARENPIPAGVSSVTISSPSGP